MFLSNVDLLFVSAERIQGTSKKTGNDYDMATVEVSDGIASVVLPLDPNYHHLTQSLTRGQKVLVTVDAQKIFGKQQLIVTTVQPVPTAK